MMCENKDWKLKLLISLLFVAGICILVSTISGCVLNVHPRQLDCVLMSDDEVFCK